MKTFSFIRYSILLILGVFLILPLVTQAQIANLSQELTISLNPEVPKPNETISASLEMYSKNIDAADITWYIDGAIVEKGKGVKTLSLTAPSAGESKTLRVKIVLSDGESFEKSITLKPLHLELMWEGNSYTPPFYKGAALFPPQGQVRVVALTDTTNMVYKWTVDGVVRQSIGGYGKNAAIITGPILGKSMEIEVEATNPTTGTIARKSIVINPVTPTLLFYENNPLYGILYTNALTSVSLKEDEATIVAVPYNLSRNDVDSAEYSWRINGISAPTITGRSAVFRKPEGVSGRSAISVELNNPNRPLQLGEGSFSINFTQ